MLRKFTAEHGHSHVPKDEPHYKVLSSFVESQQQAYRERLRCRPNPMTDERLQMLEDANITWRNFGHRKSADVRYRDWDGAVLELQKFIEEHGHANPGLLRRRAPSGDVRKKEFHQLDRFCVWARKEYVLFKEGKACQVSEERFQQLRDVGLWLEKTDGRLGSVDIYEARNESSGIR